MKKNLLFLFLLAASLSFVKAQVVFDPATYDPGSLPAGMSIVDIGGTSYCQIVLDGWNSYIEVDPVEVTEEHTDFTVMAKYAVGSDNGGYTIDEINTFLKLANDDFSIEIGAQGSASSADFTEYTIPIAATGTASRFQMAGQETTSGSWAALVGDTLWVGAVTLNGAEGPNRVELNTGNQFRIYPNPVTTELNIVCNDAIESIQIINIAGTVVQDIKGVNLIDITNLKSGLYIIKVQTNSGIYSDKFMKK